MSRVINTTQRPWSESNSQARSRPKSKKTRAIKYPNIYQEAQKLADPYWRDLISDLACGVYPNKKFTFESDQILIHRNRSKVQRYALPEDPHEAVQGLIEFMKETGERSDMDRDQDRVRQSRPEAPKPRENWEEVPERDQQRLQDWFVETMVQIHNLTPEETDDLRTELSLGFMFECFRKGDIQMSKSVIAHIRSLQFDPNDRNWVRTNLDSSAKSRKSTKPSSSTKDAPQFYKRIEKSFERFFGSSCSDGYRMSFRTQTFQT